MDQVIIWFIMLKSTLHNFPNFMMICAWIGILMIFLNRFSRVLFRIWRILQKNHTISGNSYYLVRFQIILSELILRGDSLYIISNYKLYSFARFACCCDLGGLKNHNVLAWCRSSNLIGPAKRFLRLLKNFY